MVEQLTRPPVIPGRWYPMTFEEFLDWSPNEGRAEWVDGRGMVYVGATIRHGLMVQFGSDLFSGYVRLFDLGVALSQQTLMYLPTRPSGRMPDIVIVLKEHHHRLSRLFIDGPADFAVEYISDGDPNVDLIEKRLEYETAGLPEYLAIEARAGRHGITWLRLDNDRKYVPITPDAQGRYHSTVLPGFWLDPRWFEQDPLPDADDILFEIAPEAYLARAEARRRQRDAARGKRE